MKKVLEQASFDTGNSGLTIAVGTDKNGDDETSYRLKFEQDMYGTTTEVVVPLAHQHVVEYLIFALTKTLARMKKRKYEGEYAFQQNVEDSFEGYITITDGELKSDGIMMVAVRTPEHTRVIKVFPEEFDDFKAEHEAKGAIIEILPQRK